MQLSSSNLLKIYIGFIYSSLTKVVAEADPAFTSASVETVVVTADIVTQTLNANQAGSDVIFTTLITSTIGSTSSITETAAETTEFAAIGGNNKAVAIKTVTIVVGK